MPMTLPPPIYDASRQGLVSKQSATFQNDLQMVIPLSGSFQGDPVEPSSLFIDNYNNSIPVAFTLGGDDGFIPPYTSEYIDVRGQHTILLSSTDTIKISIALYDQPQSGGSTRGLPPNGISDSMWANVACLFHFEANDGSSIAIDSKNSGLYLGTGGFPIVSQTQPEFGIGSAYNPGTSYLGTISEVWNPQSVFFGSNFTLEFSVFPVALFQAGSTQCPDGMNPIVDVSLQSNDLCICALYNGANVAFAVISVPFTGGARTILCQTAFAYALNDYYQIALTTLGGLVLYVNGAQAASDAGIVVNLRAIIYLFPQILPYTAAGNYSGKMYVDELRLTLGQRYAKNYTPSGEAFPDQ